MRSWPGGGAVFPVPGRWQTRVMAGGDGGAGLGAGLGWQWDVALSFAGEQREYVERVAAALKARGVRCFYDADEQVELWGRHLAEELPAVYAGQAAVVVVFISAEYAAGDWTRVERRAALARAVRERREYVLPARFDDTVLPGLLDDVVAVDLRRHAPERFADLVAAKLASLADTSPGGPRVPAGPPPAGRLLEEVSDPFALEVHRPVQPEGAVPELPDLPAYVPREHDTELGRVIRAAAAGRSGIAVLVGGSSTGKTRACWEALGLLRGQPEAWRLWHPIDPSRPDAALAELPRIGPRSVVWLNEAQFYLDVPEAGLGERVAAGLRELLRDPVRAPALVLATLWPRFWDTLTARPDGNDDPHAQARELLAGHDITVPAAFTPAQVAGLARAGDARLALAARSATDGQVVQFLAGAPELLARYRNAPPAARAVIEAAMDARRLGMGPELLQAFLEAAAPGYLADLEWDALGQDWLEQALAYAAVPCKGARGALTRIRPRPARPAGPAGPSGGPGYRLADYLDQHGRARRGSQFPPAEFWAAAAAHAAPAAQAGLGDAAHARGLYRDAAQLHKKAAASGNHSAVLYLADSPGCLRADGRPACWAAAHAALGDPRGVARLLDALRAAGAQDQAAALLARDPAAHAALGDPYAWPPAGQAAGGGRVRAGRRAGQPGRRTPPTPPSATRAPWPACWTACGRRARRTRPPRWPAGPGRPRRPRRPVRRGRPAGQPAGGGRAGAGRRAAGPRPGRPRRPRRPVRRGRPAGQPAGGGRAGPGRRAGRAGRRPRRPRRPRQPGRRGRPAGQPAGGGRARAGRRADRSAAGGRPVRALPQAARPRGSVPFRAAG